MIDDFIQQLHDDIHGVLSNDGGLVNVPVYRSRTPLAKDEDGNPIPGQTTAIQDDIENALAGVQFKNGKCGIAVIVLLPDVNPESVNSHGPSLSMIARVRVIEDRLFNEGATGTGLASSRLALHIVQILHERSFRGMSALRPDAKRMIEEVPLPGDRVAQEITMIYSQGVDRAAKCARPGVNQNAGQVVLTTTTPGAAIYYTTDESWPGASNDAASLYSDPIELPAGDHVIRAVAYAPDHIPSNDLWADLTVSA